MRRKHFLAVITFFACFAISVLAVSIWLVGLPAHETRSGCREKTVTPPHTFAYLTTQQRIQEFLEKDRQTGIEKETDRQRLGRNINQLSAENSATFSLVVKMRKVKCENLPPDFCAAWNEHVKAWTQMSDFLNRAVELHQKSLRENQRGDYGKYNREINRTYSEMLAAAQRYGVDFP